MKEEKNDRRSLYDVVAEHPLVLQWGMPDLLDRTTRFAAWFTSPPGVVTQLGSRKHMDQGMSQYLTDVLHPRVRERFGDRKTYALHDVTTMINFDYGARAHMVSWCIEHRREFQLTGMAHPPLNALWNMVINAPMVALSAAGFPLKLFTRLEDGIALFGLRPTKLTESAHP